MAGHWVYFTPISDGVATKTHQLVLCFFFVKEKAGQWQRALHLLDLLKITTDVTYDVVTYNALISACEKGQQWRKAVEFVGGMYWATKTDFWRFGVFFLIQKKL